MVAQKGRNVLLKYFNGSTYVAIGGIREITLTIDEEPVNITNADDAGVRKLLEGGGEIGHTIKCQGVYVDDAAFATMLTDKSTGAHRNYQMVIPGTPGKTLTGRFMIPNLELTANYKDTVMNSLTFESADVVTIS